MSAHDLWSCVVTALLLRAYLAGDNPSSPRRMAGEDPLRLFDMCRPATPPNILESEMQKLATAKLGHIRSNNYTYLGFSSIIL